MAGELWIALIAAIISSGSLTALTTYALASRRNRKKTSESNAALLRAYCEAVRFLMLRSLQHQCRIIIEKHFRTLEETEQLEKQYECLKAIGGDGWGDSLYMTALGQPIEK